MKSTLKVRAITVAVSACFAHQSAFANPTNPVVTNGNATFVTSGSTLNVTNTPNAIINWQSFSINSRETTRFIQQSAASAVLNRVTGGDPSAILGTLQSNGRVFLINPAGIVFGAGAQINTAGLVASTLNITDNDFINGRLRFDANTVNPGSVKNAGEISTPSGGFVYLIAPQVENSGIITTPAGEAILAAGNAVEIVDSIDPNQRVLVSAQSADINLSQLIVQNNGNIFSVLNSGRVSANSAVQDAAGRIHFRSAGNIETSTTSKIEAKGGAGQNGGYFRGFADQTGTYKGVFDVSGKNGGFIETSGRWIDVNDAQIIANALDPQGKGGNWLLDPNNIRIKTSGPDTNITGGPNFTTTNDTSLITTGTIETALNAGVSVTISTTTSGTNTEPGDISIEDNIAKTAGGNASLTLNAHRDITMGSSKTITSSAGKLNVTFNANTSGTGGAITLNSGSQIITNGGNVTFHGAGSASQTTGVVINGSSTLLNTGTGDITITGIGSNSTGNYGVLIDGGAQLVSAGGNIDITGTAGNGGGGDAGVFIGGSSQISNSAGGNITIHGTGGSTGVWNTGILLRNTASITSVDGNIILEGTQNGGSGGGDGGVVIEHSGNVHATGTGNISLIGHGGVTYDINLTSTAGVYANTGEIDLIADNRVYIDSATQVSTTGAVDFETFTSGTQINAGTEVLGKLSFSSATINRAFAGLVRIGTSTSGSIDVSNTISPANSTNLSVTTGGSIGGTGLLQESKLALRAAGNVALTIDGDVAANITGPGSSLTLTDGSALIVSATAIDGVTGITTNGGNISLTSANNTFIKSNVNAGSGQVTLTAPSMLTIDPGVTVSGGAATSVHYIADLMNIYGITNATNLLRINPYTNAASLTVNSNSGTSFNAPSIHIGDTSGGYFAPGALTLQASGSDLSIVNTTINATSSVTLTSTTGNVTFVTPGSLTTSVPWTLAPAAGMASTFAVGGDLILNNHLNTSGASTSIIVGNDLTIASGKQISSSSDTQSVVVGHDINLNGGAITSTGGSGFTQVVFAGNDLNLNGGSISSSGATGTQDIVAGHDLKLQATASNAEIRANGAGTELSIDVLGNVSLTSGPSGLARIYSNGHLDMIVGGVIKLDSFGLPATIGVSSGNTIDISLLSVASGGYFVNGVESTVFDPLNNSGFVVGGAPAILDTNLFFSYGGLSEEVARELGLLAHELEGSTELNELLNEGLDTEEILGGKDDSKKQNKPRECSA